MNKIPFSKNTFDHEEELAIKECFQSGWVVLGPKTQEFEEAFAKYVGAQYAVFVDSGTAALFLAIQATRGYFNSYWRDDFVYIPSLTFVSDAEVFKHSGFEIRFQDVDEETLCVDTPTANCMPTNFAGVKAKAPGAVVDSCHRIERDDVSGSTSIWCYSFYVTKNMSTVQGGMIALNNRDQYEWLLKARDHGTDKGTLQRYQGKDPLYDVKFPGWRFKGDDFRASIGLVQLKKLPENNERRNHIVERYNNNLGYRRTGNHLYPIFVNDRQRFIEELFDSGIQTSIHFRPIHTLTAYKQDIKLSVTDWIGPRIVSLPLFPAMTDEQVDIVCDAVLKTKLLLPCDMRLSDRGAS